MGTNLSSRGLTLNSSTGIISGTPNAAGDFNASITATNSEGYETKFYNFSVKKGYRSLTWNQIIAGKTYGDANFTLNASSSSAGGITYATSDASILEINGSQRTQHTLEDGLVRYWNFDYDTNASATVTALIGGLNGSKGNQVTVMPGKFGNALQFQGSSSSQSKVTFGTASRDNFGGVFSVSMWVKRTNNSGTQRLLSNKSSSSAAGFELYCSNNNLSLIHI